MARSTGTIANHYEFSASASENNANMNPFNPAKSFDITHKVYIPIKEEILYFGFMELFL
jgi:hypothetical protein